MSFLIREPEDEIDIPEIYLDNETLFTLKIHHGGSFLKFPGRRYVKGKTTYVDFFDIDKFSVHGLDECMIKLGYCSLENSIIYYNFLVPDESLDWGLRPLGNDADVLEMRKHVLVHRIIDVYIEHGSSSVNTYFTSPSKVRIEEIADEDEPVPTVNQNKPRQLLLEWPDQASNLGEFHSVDTQMLGINDLDDFDPFFGVSAFVNEDKATEDALCSGKSVIHADEDASDADEVASDADEDDSDDGSDYIEEGNDDHDYIEVDMRDFNMHIDKQAEAEGSGLPKQVSNDIDDEIIDNQEFESGDESDECSGSVRKRKLKELRKKQTSVSDDQIPMIQFFVGQGFGSKEEVKKMVDELAVQTRRQLKTVKNDKQRLRVVCTGNIPDYSSKVGSLKAESKGPKVKNKGGRGIKRNQEVTCPWVLLVSKESKSDTWIVKTFISEHKCLQSRKISACTDTFISQKLMLQIEENPTIPIKAVQEQFQRNYQVGVSRMKAFRAKTKALSQIHGDYNTQYALLRDYLEELMRSNPGTTVKLEVEPCSDPNANTRQFKRVYICLGPLKDGFKAIGRDLIGLDGCFMKGPYPGQVLTAVGLDPNNGIYPVSYALVEAETLSSWTWFLECLASDLDLEGNSNFTFISDRQKGLLPAISKLFPCAEHRFCLRHVHENMKLKWRGKGYKDILWKLATCTTIPEFQKNLEELKQMNNDAYLWVCNIPPKHWSRSHFSGRAKSDVLLNNMCEVMNSKILDARDKPIITALEYIREYLMKRIVNVLAVIDKTDGPLTPTATRLLDQIKYQAAKYSVIWNGGDEFQVSGPWGDQCVVDVNQRTCTCRGWELSGIPCKHAVAAIWNMSTNSQQVGLPENWVNSVYSLDTWKKVYSFKVHPIAGRIHWPKSVVPTVITPPKHHKQVGRPKKARKKSELEKEELSQGGKLSRKFISVTCSKCGKRGHNCRACRGQEETS